MNQCAKILLEAAIKGTVIQELQDDGQWHDLSIKEAILASTYQLDNEGKISTLRFKPSKMDGYTLALGAWIESASQTTNLNLLEAGLLDAHEPEREGPKFLDWVADRLVHVYGESENVDFVICLRRRAAKAAAAIARVYEQRSK